MNNDLVEEKSWGKRNWKWLIPLSGIVLISFGIFFSSGMDGVATDLAQAYSDTKLYEHAIDKINADKRVSDLLGEIKPMDKLAILEGQVEYSNENKTIQSTIWIVGSKGRAKMDISADWINKKWSYTKINVRIKNPSENKQTIQIATEE